jgi:GAF domain-containing protein
MARPTRSGARVSSEWLAAALLEMNSDGTLAEYADWLTLNVLRTFSADHGVIGLYAVQSDTPEEIFYHLEGVSEEYRQASMSRIVGPRNWRVIRRAAATGEHIFVPDAETSPLLRDISDLVRAEGYKSLLSMPVRLDGGLLGVVTLYYDAPVNLDDAYFSTLQAFLDKAAPTLREHAQRERPAAMT